MGSLVHVMYGTESGNSEKVATITTAALTALGYETELIDIGQLELEDLKEINKLFLVISTNGEGEMPVTAEAIWSEAEEKQLTGLDKMQYAVLGLGDSSYDYYCQAGTDWDEYLERAGAKRIVERGEADSDYMPESKAWLIAALAAFSGKDEVEIETVVENVLSGAVIDDDEDGWSEKRPWKAKILVHRNLCTEQSSKFVRHYELDLKGSGITYKPGDCIEIVPKNEQSLVEGLIETMGWSGDESVLVHGESMTIRKALEEHLELRQPTLKLLQILSQIPSSVELKKIINAPRKEAREALENFSYGHDVLSLVKEYSQPPRPKTDFKSRLKALIGRPEFYPRFDAFVFVNYLKDIHPRAYSIASSNEAHPDTVHLTVADVRYERNGRKHNGACSVYLADRVKVGDTVDCWLRINKNFALPEDNSKDIIMVGPGTGIAPFIGFLQERAHQKAEGKNWLFFGDRESANDFLYREELEAFQKEGVLTRLDTAFSRDQKEKVYVQHKMAEAGKELFQWLDQGAAIYVCGDAKYMAKDVENTLLKIIAEHGNMSAEAADKYLKAMQREKRYLKDVY